MPYPCRSVYSGPLHVSTGHHMPTSLSQVLTSLSRLALCHCQVASLGLMAAELLAIAAASWLHTLLQVSQWGC